MAVIKVKWHVDELANVMSLFDVQKVYRATSKDGTYSEITDANSRVQLQQGVENYLYDDTSGNATDWYRVSYYNSQSSLESSLSSPVEGSLGSYYVTVSEMRTAGLSVTVVPDDILSQQISDWSVTIENFTGMWWHDRELTITESGTDCDTLWLRYPVISLNQVCSVYGAEMTDYRIVGGPSDHRRDRLNPRLLLSGSAWVKGDNNYQLKGHFGWLDNGTVPSDIKRVITKILLKLWKNDDPYLKWQIAAGAVISEHADAHSIQYGSLMSAAPGPGAFELFLKDPEVDAILSRYRARHVEVIV